jgi:hypothetical protein
MITEKFKQTIFDKLSEDLSHTELFLHKESIWFIDRKNKYWYLSFKSSGQLYWRWQFFVEFFELFSLERPEYEPLIKEWVEGVLKGGVTTTVQQLCPGRYMVEGVLKGGVTTTDNIDIVMNELVEGVLKGGVTTTYYHLLSCHIQVEGVLKGGVTTTEPDVNTLPSVVEGVLKGDVTTTISNHLRGAKCMEEILNNGTTI